MPHEASPSEATLDTTRAGFFVSVRPGQTPCAWGRVDAVVLYRIVVHANVLLLEPRPRTFSPTMNSKAAAKRAKLVQARRVVRFIVAASTSKKKQTVLRYMVGNNKSFPTFKLV
jgi:hypothetical protein